MSIIGEHEWQALLCWQRFETSCLKLTTMEPLIELWNDAFEKKSLKRRNWKQMKGVLRGFHFWFCIWRGIHTFPLPHHPPAHSLTYPSISATPFKSSFSYFETINCRSSSSYSSSESELVSAAAGAAVDGVGSGYVVTSGTSTGGHSFLSVCTWSPRNILGGWPPLIQLVACAWAWSEGNFRLDVVFWRSFCLERPLTGVTPPGFFGCITTFSVAASLLLLRPVCLVVQRRLELGLLKKAPRLPSIVLWWGFGKLYPISRSNLHLFRDFAFKFPLFLILYTDLFHSVFNRNAVNKRVSRLNYLSSCALFYVTVQHITRAEFSHWLPRSIVLV